MQQVQQAQERVLQQIHRLERNSVSRVLNSRKGFHDSIEWLEPPVGVALPANLPETHFGLRGLNNEQLVEILGTYNLPTEGDKNTRCTRLAQHIGLA
jgi:hypothetical protein